MQLEELAHGVTGVGDFYARKLGAAGEGRLLGSALLARGDGHQPRPLVLEVHLGAEDGPARGVGDELGRGEREHDVAEGGLLDELVRVALIHYRDLVARLVLARVVVVDVDVGFAQDRPLDAELELALHREVARGLTLIIYRVAAGVGRLRVARGEELAPLELDVGLAAQLDVGDEAALLLPRVERLLLLYRAVRGLHQLAVEGLLEAGGVVVARGAGDVAPVAQPRLELEVLQQEPALETKREFFAELVG